MSQKKSNQIPAAKAPTSRSWPQRMALALIYFYQHVVSPLTPPSCRYRPTCSSYAKHAIEEHGWRLGIRMAFLRIIRCHPLHPGGLDPVPCRHQSEHRLGPKSPSARSDS